MALKKYYMVLGSVASYRPPFEGKYQEVYTFPKHIDEIDLAVFIGGEDVDPSMYGEKNIASSGCNLGRDLKELEMFYKFRDAGIPMIGICRGSQFLNVMHGGKLIQHVNGHAGPRHLIYRDNEVPVEVTSTHHQVSEVSPRGEVLWKSEEGYPEVILWKDTNSLGVQYHPEYMDPESEGWKLFQTLIDKYCQR